jgi:hypothetical protein
MDLRSLPPPPVAPNEGPIREPSRELLLPVVHAANMAVRWALEGRSHKALVTVTIDTSREKARFYVTLVASTDDDGELWAVDTSRDLIDATATMLVEDVRSGNARWHKLVIRIDCEGEGAAIQRIEIK